MVETKKKSGRPRSRIAEKLGLESGMRARFIGAPAGFWEEFGTLPKGVALFSGGLNCSEFVLGFARNLHELEQGIAGALQSVAPAGRLWLAYPSRKSGQQTSLTDDDGWEPLADEGWEPVELLALNAAWQVCRWVKPTGRRPKKVLTAPGMLLAPKPSPKKPVAKAGSSRAAGGKKGAPGKTAKLKRTSSRPVKKK